MTPTFDILLSEKVIGHYLYGGEANGIADDIGSILEDKAACLLRMPNSELLEIMPYIATHIYKKGELFGDLILGPQINKHFIRIYIKHASLARHHSADEIVKCFTFSGMGLVIVKQSPL